MVTVFGKRMGMLEHDAVILQLGLEVLDFHVFGCQGGTFGVVDLWNGRFLEDLRGWIDEFTSLEKSMALS